MSEKWVHLCVTEEHLRPANLWAVRWITEDDSDIFIEPFRKDQDHGWTLEEFQELEKEGYMYCGIFAANRLCSIAGVWKRASDVWEVIAVGTREEYRRWGMARSVVAFAAEYILQHVEAASYTSRKSNIASIRTAQSAGFGYCANIVDNDKWCAKNPRPPISGVACPLIIPHKVIATQNG